MQKPEKEFKGDRELAARPQEKADEKKTIETDGRIVAAETAKEEKKKIPQMDETPISPASEIKTELKEPAVSDKKETIELKKTEPSREIDEQHQQKPAEREETRDIKKPERIPVKVVEGSDVKIRSKIKSDKGGAFIKKKILSKIKLNISEEIGLLEETKEDESMLQNVSSYKRKVQNQYKPKAEKSAVAVLKPIVPKQKKSIKIGDRITVSNLSQIMGIKATEIIKRLITLGVMAGINDPIDADTASMIVKDMGFKPDVKQQQSPEMFLEETDSPEKIKLRPPVVTIMGHVDHGKTTLLDAIRATKVAEGEAGGITQHIGAYKITIDGKTMVFLDTPGHEAFTAMRARGAKVTDIVVLVVAADDGVMPQTIEAVDHAKAAGVPIIVATNKIDKPEAQPQKVMQQLSDYGLVPEQWGGNTLYAMISAKKKTGITELLELILLQAEMMELKANPDKKAKAIIIETRIDKGFGIVATAIIKDGTLKKGDYIVYGSNYSKVKTLLDDSGNVIPHAGPSTPVETIGFESLPEVGDTILVVDNEEIAHKIIEYRRNRHQGMQSVKKTKISLEDIFKKIEEGSIKELPVLLKCDVTGSLGAVMDAIKELSNENVKVTIIHAGIGGITESDIMLASASNGIAIGFNVRPDVRAVQAASTQNIEIKTYRVIYELIDDIKKAIRGLLKPVVKEKVIGRAKVVEIYKINKVGVIAGSMVIDGKVERGANVRVLRESVVVYESKISSLKRFKENVKNVDKGFECGVGIEKFNDIKKDDELEVYRLEEEAFAN